MSGSKRASSLLGTFAAGLLCYGAAGTAAADRCTDQAAEAYRSQQYSEALTRLDGCSASAQAMALRGHALWRLGEKRAAREVFAAYVSRTDITASERQEVSRLLTVLDWLLDDHKEPSPGATRSAAEPAPASQPDRPARQRAVGRTSSPSSGQRGANISASLASKPPRSGQVVGLAQPRSSTPASLTAVADGDDSGPALWPTLVTGAITAGAGAVALGFGLAARSARDDFDDQPSNELRDRIASRALVADVMIGVTAAAAATTLVFYLRYLIQSRRPGQQRGRASDASALVLHF